MQFDGVIQVKVIEVGPHKTRMRMIEHDGMMYISRHDLKLCGISDNKSENIIWNKNVWVLYDDAVKLINTKGINSLQFIDDGYRIHRSSNGTGYQERYLDYAVSHAIEARIRRNPVRRTKKTPTIAKKDESVILPIDKIKNYAKERSAIISILDALSKAPKSLNDRILPLRDCLQGLQNYKDELEPMYLELKDSFT